MSQNRAPRILIYGLNFTPELTGVGKYSGELAGYLAGRGCEMRVITSYPYYPDWKVRTGFTHWRYSRNSPQEKGAKISVYRCPLWVPARPGGLKRILHLASFALTSFPVSLAQAFWKPDLVFCVAPTILTAPAALLTSRLSGCRSWLHLHDFEINAAWSVGLMNHFKFIHSAGSRIFRYFTKKFDRVSSISGQMMETLAASGIEKTKLYFFPNWVNTEEIRSDRNSNGFRKELGLSEKDIVILYSGSMTIKQNLPVVLDAAAILSHRPDLQFVMCGDGQMRASLQKQASGLKNIRFLPPQAQEKFAGLMSLADIHLLPQLSTAADLVMPSKLAAMLASGKPVVATAAQDTEIGRLLAGAGLLASPGNPAALADAITTLAGDEKLRGRLGKAGRLIAEERFSSVKVLGEFYSSLEEFVFA